MTQQKFWLASNSPRRKEIFSWMDWNWDAYSANVDESQRGGEKVREYIIRVADEKASSPIPDIQPQDIVIAADTIVVLDGKILGKPANGDHAYQMLISLRDRSHWVMTAIAIRTGDHSTSFYDVCKSRVHMRNYSDSEINQYIESGDPLDKAGSYAIQNIDFHPADNFNGCFASVMGMPLCHLERSLSHFPDCGIKGLAAICQNQLKYKCPITKRVMAGGDVG